MPVSSQKLRRESEPTPAQAPAAALRLTALEIDDERWTSFVERAPGAVLFHHPSWARLLADCYGYRPFALVLLDGDGVAAGVPAIEIRSVLGRRRWTSLPFTDSLPPLARDERLIPLLVAELDAARQAQGISQVEIRAEVTDSRVRPQPTGFVHVLQLASDPAKVFRTFKRSCVQQRITKAEREGVTVRRGSSKDDLTQTFYELHLDTRHRLGVPIQPRRYFELMWERIIAPGRGFVLLAHANEIPIAGAVFLTWNGTITYKYSASRHEFWQLRPNNLVIWNAIRWGCENGFHTFDFGRTELGNEGLRSFKRGWGTAELPLTYSTLCGRAPTQAIGRAADMLRRPIQTMPAWFCRLIGELAYKHAA
jgi:CelD/BcsL family acetyltransferase involved in cellulose biosynthesis